MDHLTYARAQMGLSLAFHMVFAAAGVALPLFMVIADARYLRTGDRDYLHIAKRMAKGTSILFAVGAVSGTVLSFELGLLWPRFMGTFGEVLGFPFALEGYAFFTEAIFLGVYLYGRDRLPPKLHLAAGVVVALSGATSAFFVTLVNAAMNDPVGFTMAAGKPVNVDPIAAMWSPGWKQQTLHALLACYEATAVALAGIHAFVLLRHPKSPIFRKAFAITLAVAAISSVLQPLSGHESAQSIAAHQPLKLAAAEAHYHTGRRAPIIVAGLPDDAAREVRYGLPLPGALSLLATNSLDGEVKGLDDFPEQDWPPVTKTHIAFDIMVGAGSACALIGAIAIALTLRRRAVPTDRWFLRIVVACGPLGLIALEAGWCVTEFGRQPWIVRSMMRTSEAVTPFPHLAAPFWLFTLVYVLLGVSVIFLLYRQLRASPAGDDEEPIPASGAAVPGEVDHAG